MCFYVKILINMQNKERICNEISKLYDKTDKIRGWKQNDWKLLFGMKENFIFTDNKRVGIGGRICVCKERFLEYGMTIIRSFSIIFDIIAIFVIAVIVNKDIVSIVLISKDWTVVWIRFNRSKGFNFLHESCGCNIMRILQCENECTVINFIIFYINKKIRLWRKYYCSMIELYIRQRYNHLLFWWQSV